jgi:hypothetical protein
LWVGAWPYEPYDLAKGACAQPVGVKFDFVYQSGYFVIVFSQIGPFWRFLVLLEGDLTPKRGQIYVGSWDSITEPKNYINQAL